MNMYNILIVDDEKIERNGIKLLLKRMGINLGIIEAGNGKEAYDYLMSDDNKGEGHVDILLTDVKMPFMDGIELIRNVKDGGVKLKTIIFSGYNEFEYAKLAVKLGVEDYILKPVAPDEFKNTMLKVISELDEELKKNEDYNKQANSLRQFYLYSLINGSAAKGIVENTEFLNGFNRLVLIEFNSDFFGKYEFDFDKVVQIIKEEWESLYLNLNPQQSVILLKTPYIEASRADTNYRIEHFLRGLHEYIYEKSRQFMYAAVSDVFSDYHKLSGVMDELEALMNNKFYQMDRYIYSDYVNEQTPVLVQIDDDALMKQMKQDIKMKDVTFLRIHFEALCKKYRGQNNFSHIYIKFVFSNLLKDFYDNIPGSNQDEFSREIDRLYTSEDFSCIMDIVNKNIDLLEKSFGSDPVSSHREIEMVKDYIHGHFGEEISAQQLADMVYLAPSYLSSLFKKETGQNLSKYIKQYRMEKARQMLEDTNMKIVCISEKVGYPNVSYFCQSFREYCGVSPQKFRENAE